MKPQDLERATKSYFHHYRTKGNRERTHPPRKLNAHEKEYFAQLDICRDENLDAMLDELHEVQRIKR